MASHDLKYPDPWKFMNVHYTVSYEDMRKYCRMYWKSIHMDKTKESSGLSQCLGKIKVLIDCREAFEKFQETFSVYNGNAQIAWEAVENLLVASREVGKSNEDLLSLRFVSQDENIKQFTDTLKILYDYLQGTQPFSATGYEKCQRDITLILRGFRKEANLFTAVKNDHANEIEKLKETMLSDREEASAGFYKEKLNLENKIMNLENKVKSLTELNDKQSSSLKEFQNQIEDDKKKRDQLLDISKQLQSQSEDLDKKRKIMETSQELLDKKLMEIDTLNSKLKINKATEIIYLDFANEQSTETEDLVATKLDIKSSCIEADAASFTPSSCVSQEIEVVIMDVDPDKNEMSIQSENIPKPDDNNQSASSTEKTIFVCPVCERKITHKNSIKRHMKSHEGEPIICQFCKKPVARIDIYKRHLTTMHPNLKPTKINTLHAQMLILQQKKNSSVIKK